MAEFGAVHRFPAFRSRMCYTVSAVQKYIDNVITPHYNI